MKLLRGEKRPAYATRKTIQRFSLRVKMEYGGGSDGRSCSGGGATSVAFSSILRGSGVAAMVIRVVDSHYS